MDRGFSPLLEEDPSCWGCDEIFSEPLVHSCLACGHCFCKICLLQHRRSGSTWMCPTCSQKPARPEEMCGDHSRKLVLFCRDDLLLICVSCQRSLKHQGHRVCSSEEAVEESKAELKNAVKPLKEKLNMFKKTKLTCEKISELMKSQVQHTEKQIKAQFEELYQFLRDEETARLASLKKEEEDKSLIITQKIEDIEADISSLSDTIRSLEQEMGVEDIPFLKNYKATIKRTWGTFPEPELISGVLIDVAKHLGSLKYQVWMKMLDTVQYTPVVVNPNTAANCFMLSDDLSTVHYCTETFDLPDNPERFDISAEMLGSESFSSGRHSWEVDVRNNTYWVIGITKENINPKGKHVLTPAEGFWTIRLRNGEYKACSAPWTPLNVTEELQVVRIQLDMDRGKVSFYDSRERLPLFTFTDIVSPRVFPYFCTACKLHPLRILPTRLSVIPENHRSFH